MNTTGAITSNCCMGSKLWILWAAPQVGSTPGVTKGIQEIHLDKHIRLLDSPGIVFTSGEGAAAAALRNAIKVSGVRDVMGWHVSPAAYCAAVLLSPHSQPYWCL